MVGTDMSIYAGLHRAGYNPLDVTLRDEQLMKGKLYLCSGCHTWQRYSEGVQGICPPCRIDVRSQGVTP
jgi:hypothetical protein